MKLQFPRPVFEPGRRFGRGYRRKSLRWRPLKPVLIALALNIQTPPTAPRWGEYENANEDVSRGSPLGSPCAPRHSGGIWTDGNRASYRDCIRSGRRSDSNRHLDDHRSWDKDNQDGL